MHLASWLPWETRNPVIFNVISLPGFFYESRVYSWFLQRTCKADIYYRNNFIFTNQKFIIILYHCDLNIYSYSCTLLFTHLKDFTHISLTHPHNITHSHKSIHIFIQLYTIIIHSFPLYIHFLSSTHTFTHSYS